GLAAGQVEEHIAGLERREATLEGQLRVMTGTPGAQALVLVEEDLPAMPERSILELVATAERSRLDLKAAESEVRARRENVAGQRGAYFSSVDLIGNYAVYSHFNNFDTFFKPF